MREFCEQCGEEITNEPQHDVVVVSIVKINGKNYNDLDGIKVCNKCMFSNFEYCTDCNMYYEKDYMHKDCNICLACFDKN